MENAAWFLRGLAFDDFVIWRRQSGAIAARALDRAARALDRAARFIAVADLICPLRSNRSSWDVLEDSYFRSYEMEDDE